MKIFRLLLFVQFVIMAGTAKSDPIDDYLKQLYRSHIMPGFSVVVVKGDQVTFSKGYGVEYIDGNQPMTVSTSTAIGSLGKSFTTMAVMQLAEEGKIDLDAPVIKYLPWFHTANKNVSDQITVRMLLDNTSGLHTPFISDVEKPEKAAEKLVHSMESVYLTVTPGTRYEYSNDGFALAGLLISKVSGMSYEEYMDQFIFKPLEMKRTTNNPGKFDDLHVLYGHYAGINQAIPVHRQENGLSKYVAAGSLLRSSATDIGHYLICLLNHGQYKGRRIISPESIKEMWQPYSTFPGISTEDGGQNLPFHYGMGWFIGKIDGKNCIFHGGNRRNMSSMTMLFPEKSIGISFLTNIDLTFIDKYQYPNLVNIANNIIRLSLDEPASNYAIPITPDPTRNNYILPSSEETKYTGNYLLTAGEDWVYQGSHLSIAKGKEGLEGTITKGNQIIERFKLDFITPRTAVTRNLSLYKNVSVKFTSNGEISDIFIGENQYSRLSEGYYKRFQQVDSPGKNIGFFLPKDWSINWQEENFTGTSKSASQDSIAGFIFPTEMDIDHCLEILFPKHEILHKGQIFNETAGVNFWNEVAVISTHDNQAINQLICTTNNKNQTYVLVLSSTSQLTYLSGSLLSMLLKTFTWNNPPD